MGDLFCMVQNPAQIAVGVKIGIEQPKVQNIWRRVCALHCAVEPTLQKGNEGYIILRTPNFVYCVDKAAVFSHTCFLSEYKQNDFG